MGMRNPYINGGFKNGKHSVVSIVMFDYRRVWRFFQERFMDCAISCIGNCNQQGINPTHSILQAVILNHCHVAQVFFLNYTLHEDL